jgi:hypothetical protein
MSESISSDFDSRLAVLEERTKPREKTILERIKDWSGVLTFIVAVLYTYPLGVWDRFVVTAEQQRIKEMDALRGTILRVTELDSETFRLIASIADVQQQTLLSQVQNARKGTMLIPEIPLIEKHYSELSGAELQLLGYQLNYLGDQGGLVLRILDLASQKMIKAKNNVGAADTYRTQAQLYSSYGSLGPNLPKSRDLFQKSIQVSLQAEPTRSLGIALAVAMDWANLEALSGNWHCTEALGNWAISQFQIQSPPYAAKMQSQLTQMAVTRKAMEASSKSLPQTQPGGACPKNILPWNPVGWPWAAVGEAGSAASPKIPL